MGLFGNLFKVFRGKKTTKPKVKEISDKAAKKKAEEMVNKVDKDTMEDVKKMIREEAAARKAEKLLKKQKAKREKEKLEAARMKPWHKPDPPEPQVPKKKQAQPAAKKEPKKVLSAEEERQKYLNMVMESNKDGYKANIKTKAYMKKHNAKKTAQQDNVNKKVNPEQRK